MKREILAASLLIITSTSAIAGQWEAVTTNASGSSLYTASDSTNIEAGFVGLYADRDTCAITLTYGESALGHKWSTGSYTTTLQVKVDDEALWSNDNASMELTHDYYEKTKVTYLHLSTAINEDLLAEIVTGNKLIVRAQKNDGDWTDTFRFDLNGSSRRINEMLEQCAGGEWGETSVTNSRKDSDDDEWSA